jgi:hypothetical protein
MRTQTNLSNRKSFKATGAINLRLKTLKINLIRILKGLGMDRKIPTKTIVQKLKTTNNLGELKNTHHMNKMVKRFRIILGVQNKIIRVILSLSKMLNPLGDKSLQTMARISNNKTQKQVGDLTKIRLKLTTKRLKTNLHGARNLELKKPMSSIKIPNHHGAKRMIDQKANGQIINQTKKTRMILRIMVSLTGKEIIITTEVLLMAIIEEILEAEETTTLKEVTLGLIIQEVVLITTMVEEILTITTLEVALITTTQEADSMLKEIKMVIQEGAGDKIEITNQIKIDPTEEVSIEMRDRSKVRDPKEGVFSKKKEEILATKDRTKVTKVITMEEEGSTIEEEEGSEVIMITLTEGLARINKEIMELVTINKIYLKEMTLQTKANQKVGVIITNRNQTVGIMATTKTSPITIRKKRQQT